MGGKPAKTPVFTYAGWRQTKQKLLHARVAFGHAPSALLLVGPSGSGKSLMLKRVGWELRNRGIVVHRLSAAAPATVQPTEVLLFDNASEADLAPFAALIDSPPCFTIIAASPALADRLQRHCSNFARLLLPPMQPAEAASFAEARLRKAGRDTQAQQPQLLSALATEAGMRPGPMIALIDTGWAPRAADDPVPETAPLPNAPAATVALPAPPLILPPPTTPLPPLTFAEPPPPLPAFAAAWSEAPLPSWQASSAPVQEIAPAPPEASLPKTIPPETSPPEAGPRPLVREILPSQHAWLPHSPPTIPRRINVSRTLYWAPAAGTAAVCVVAVLLLRGVGSFHPGAIRLAPTPIHVPPIATAPPASALLPPSPPATPPPAVNAPALTPAPTPAPLPPPQNAQSATPDAALPANAIPVVRIVFPSNDPASSQRATLLAGTLSAHHVAVSRLQPVPPGSTPPGVQYFFAEDRPQALAIAALANLAASSTTPARPGTPPPLPGTINIVLRAIPLHPSRLRSSANAALTSPTFKKGS